MTPQRAKELLPVIQAFAEGKRIQWKYFSDKTWQTITEDYCSFEEDDQDFRIKPTPSLRPWKPEEVPVGALLRVNPSIDSTPNWHWRGLLVGVNDLDLFINDCAKKFTAQQLLDRYEHSLDHGTTWLPCGVEE